MPSARAYRAHYIRLLLRNEPSPAYPYRNFVFRLKYFFLRSVSELFYFFGDAFGPGYSGLAIARLLLRNEPSPAYPYRNFRKLVTFRNWHRWF